MFIVFPIMQQLHEMLYYLYEAISLKETHSIHQNLKSSIHITDELTSLNYHSLKDVDINSHRSKVSELLFQTSDLVRSNISQNKMSKIPNGTSLIGANLKRKNLRGVSLRGALLIAADLSESDLSFNDFLGADLRDAKLDGANLTGCLFLTQAQVNAAKGNRLTILPPSLNRPKHWE